MQGGQQVSTRLTLLLKMMWVNHILGTLDGPVHYTNLFLYHGLDHATVELIWKGIVVEVTQ